MTSPPRPQREHWRSRLGMVLAVAGSAVGLGNFLRFPGVAAEHGGGAFLIPYFAALLLLGIPIGWVEWTMGRYGGEHGLHSAPNIIGFVGGGGALPRALGTLGVLVPLVVYLYYCLIESWCLGYAWAYLTGDLQLGADAAEQVTRAGAHFARVTGLEENGAMLLEPSGAPLICWLIVMGLNLWFVSRGLSAGIEAFCRWAMPLMALCATIVLIRVLTLGTPDPTHPERNVAAGLEFMWSPDLSPLADFETWLAAAGQVFFSLSVGFGVIINYASYLRRRDDVVTSNLTAIGINEVFELCYGGLITITAAFIFLGANFASGTFSLGFQTLPVVFAHMGSWGRAIGAIWFFMLFLAAITSSLSMLQPVRAFLVESASLSRVRVIAILAVFTTLGSLWVAYYSKDLVALDTMDFWAGTLGIFLLAFLQLVCFGWLWGVERGLTEAHRGAKLRIPHAYRWIIRYVAPAYLLIVFVGFCIQKLPGHIDQLLKNDTAQWTFLLVVGILAMLVLIGSARGSSLPQRVKREDRDSAPELAVATETDTSERRS